MTLLLWSLPCGHCAAALTHWRSFSDFPCTTHTVAAYCQLADEWGLSPTSLALRFVLGHPLVASAVVGATSSEQLEELIAAARAPPLEAQLLEAIDAIHQRYPNPAP